MKRIRKALSGQTIEIWFLAATNKEGAVLAKGKELGQPHKESVKCFSHRVRQQKALWNAVFSLYGVERRQDKPLP